MSHHVFITTCSSTGAQEEHVISNLDVFSNYSEYIRARFFNGNNFAPETGTITYLPLECGSHGMSIISYLINCHAAYGEKTNTRLPEEHALYQDQEILKSVIHTLQFLCISSEKAKVLFGYNEERTSYTIQQIITDAYGGVSPQRTCGQLLHSVLPHLNYKMLFEEKAPERTEEKMWLMYWRIRFALAIGWSVDLIIDGETLLHKYATFFVDDHWIVPMGWRISTFAKKIPDQVLQSTGDVVAHIIQLLIDEGASLSIHSTTRQGEDKYGPTVLSTLVCGNQELYEDAINLCARAIDCGNNSWHVRSQHKWTCYGDVRQSTQRPLYFILQGRNTGRLLEYACQYVYGRYRGSDGTLLSKSDLSLGPYTARSRESFLLLGEAWQTPEYFELFKRYFRLQDENSLHYVGYFLTKSLEDASDADAKGLWKFYSEQFPRLLEALVALHRLVDPIKPINRAFIDMWCRPGIKGMTLLTWVCRKLLEMERRLDVGHTKFWWYGLLKKLLKVPGVIEEMDVHPTNNTRTALDLILLAQNNKWADASYHMFELYEALLRRDVCMNTRKCAEVSSRMRIMLETYLDYIGPILCAQKVYSVDQLGLPNQNLLNNALALFRRINTGILVLFGKVYDITDLRTIFTTTVDGTYSNPLYYVCFELLRKYRLIFRVALDSYPSSEVEMILQESGLDRTDLKKGLRGNAVWNTMPQGYVLKSIADGDWECGPESLEDWCVADGDRRECDPDGLEKWRWMDFLKSNYDQGYERKAEIKRVKYNHNHFYPIPNDMHVTD